MKDRMKTSPQPRRTGGLPSILPFWESAKYAYLTEVDPVSWNRKYSLVQRQMSIHVARAVRWNVALGAGSNGQFSDHADRMWTPWSQRHTAPPRYVLALSTVS